MHNVYEQFLQLLPNPPLQAGTVTEVGAGVVTVQLPGGGVVKARGAAGLGQKVFVRDGTVEAVAGAHPSELVDVHPRQPVADDRRRPVGVDREPRADRQVTGRADQRRDRDGPGHRLADVERELVLRIEGAVGIAAVRRQREHHHQVGARIRRVRLLQRQRQLPRRRERRTRRDRQPDRYRQRTDFTHAKSMPDPARGLDQPSRERDRGTRPQQDTAVPPPRLGSSGMGWVSSGGVSGRAFRVDFGRVRGRAGGAARL